MTKQAAPIPRSCPRALHLIDIENMAAGWVTPDVCREFLGQYLHAGLLGPMDQVIVGVSHGSAGQTFPLPAGWRRALGPRGLNSADIALAAALPPASRLGSFHEVVIASGDHFFCGVAHMARLAGLRVTLVSRTGAGVSKMLLRLSDRHVALSCAPGGPASTGARVVA